MSAPFFSDRETQERFRAICRAWDGTPFREHSRAKGSGGGIDCAGFVEEVMFEVGAGPRFDFERSCADYRGHLHNTRILQTLRDQLAPYLVEIEPRIPMQKFPPEKYLLTGLMCGDILVIKAPVPGVWHLPVMLDDRTFAHVAAPLGYSEADITQEDYRSRLKALFRVRKEV